MNGIKLAVVFALVVAWCGGAVRETGSKSVGEKMIGDRQKESECVEQSVP